MKDRKKYFLKDAVVMLIAVFMITSILPSAMAYTSEKAEDRASYSIFDMQSENPYVPIIRPGTPMGETLLNPDGSLAGFGADYMLGYTDGHTENALKWTDETPWTEAIELSGDHLPVIGDNLCEIYVSCGCDDYGFYAEDYEVYAATGSLPDMTTLGDDETLVAQGTASATGWTSVITDDYAVTGDTFVIVKWTTAVGYPAGFDTSITGEPRGEHMLDHATTNTWTSLTALGYPAVWGLEAGFCAGGGPGPVEDCIPNACDFAIAGFTDEFNAQSKGVDVDGDKVIDYYIWNSLPKDICIKIANKGEIAIGELKLLLDLYKKVCGPTITIIPPKYDLTKFPCCGMDYPIYFPEGDPDDQWWITDDCDGDSWVLQGGADNRWYDNNQAWRCTKGEDRTYGADEDVYLGKADCAQPNVYDNLTTPMFDIAGAACATFSFWHWCEGEYTIDDDGNVNPVDYGTIAYSLDNGVTWVEIPITEFLAYDTEDQWEQVTVRFMNTGIDANDMDYMHPYNMICDDCEPQPGEIVIEDDLTNAQLRMRFIWEKDPCLQFEGWYIDGVEVTFTLDYELELVCQTHEIIELPGCDPEVGVVWLDYCFPLPCDVDDDTWYEVHIYGQVFDPMGCEIDTTNNEFKYQFKIKDILDMACIEIIPDEHQYVDVGENIPVNVTVQNLGTFGVNNVPVDIKVGPLMNLQILEDHYETNTLGDYSIYYFNFDGCPTLMPYTWSKGWPQIDQIYDNAPAEARSMLPGSECVVFGENIGGLPTLPEDTGMVFVAPDVIDLDPNHNGMDCDDAIGGTMTFGAKWSMEIEEYNYYYSGPVASTLASTVMLGLLPSDGPMEGYILFVSLGIESDPDGYENDWQSFEFDLYNLFTSVYINNYGYDYIPETQIGFFIYNEGPCTEANMNYMPDSPDGGSTNSMNPVPWTGFMLDNWKISVQDYSDADMTTFTTLYTGELQPGETQELTTSWPAELCSHVITAETRLDGDVNPYNDACCAVVVTATQKECIGEFKVDDMTPEGGDCLWHVCCNRNTEDDCYAWAGEEGEHSAQYVNNMHDYMVSPSIDVTGYEPHGVCVNFTNWFKFASMADYGAVQMKQGGNWVQLWKTSGTTTNGAFEPVSIYIDGPTCAAYPIFQLRFLMHSDSAGVSEGWYVDDIYVIDVTAGGVAATDWFGYNDGHTENALKWTDGTPWYEAIELSSPEADPYLGYDITDIYVSCGCDDYGFYAETFNVYASNALGDIGTFTVLDSGLVASATGWTQVALANSYTLTGTDYLCVGWMTAVGYPAGFDTTNVNSKGDHMLDHGTTSTWTHTATLGYPSVWGLDAGLSLAVPTDLVFGDPIPGIFQGPDTSIEDFEDQDIAPWICDASAGGGQYWRKTDDAALVPNGVAPLDDDPCDDCASGFYVIPSLNLAADGYGSSAAVDNAIAFKLDLTNELLNPNLLLFTCMMNYNLVMERAYIEFSLDWDGVEPMEDATWVTYWAHTPGDLYGDSTGGWMSLEDLTALTDPVPMERWNIDEFVGDIVWIRFRLETDGGAGIGEGWAIDDLYIEFKETGTPFQDLEAPITSFCYDSDTNTVTLLAVDLPLNKGVGVDATYYKVDGGATQTYGGPFVITGEGPHTVEYWSVDNNGNEETHKTTSMTIDTLPPEVTITSPEAGKLYLFGSPIMNRILSEKTLCIGKVPVEATATDESGVLNVLFKYNGETTWDNEAPFEDTYSEMHFGPLTISVKAIDVNGLESAPVTMDIVVYCLGLF
jgi:hypothetical protein